MPSRETQKISQDDAGSHMKKNRSQFKDYLDATENERQY